ncbi:MAG TPA: cytochrome b N-terminal domain-containing protein [Pirellulales bacterium]|nr:cytochrome b N-terminal domain-containing protein [Pirellulales bacterium]
MKTFFDWLDARTDYRALLAPLHRRVLPGGPSWWLTSASCLWWVFVIEVVTGLLLMTTYSPSTTSAWASVHYIEQSPAGSFIRGVHYFASHALIVLLAIHLVRVLLSAAFRPPRELIWITGLLLMPLAIAWAVTGNPLSASQKGMTQIEVEANIVGSTPVVGPALQRLFVGGDEVGHLTLTHLYFLHVGLLPLATFVLLGVHLSQVYRHGLTQAAGDAAQARPYWPYQSVRNAMAVAAVACVLAVLAWRRGAPLEAPADASFSILPRPEWYFRCLFELRRYFTGDWEFIATLVLPLATLALFIAIPLVDLVVRRRVSFILRLLVLAVGAGGWGWLTWTSLARDWHDPEYLAAQSQAEALDARARALADREQIPPAGASLLLRDDPKTQGPLLFARHCASCHSHANDRDEGIVAEEPSAPNLYGFGGKAWLSGLFDPEAINGPRYFGHTKFAGGDMVGAVQELLADADEEEGAEARSQLELVVEALAAEAALPQRAGGKEKPADIKTGDIERGRELLAGDLGCTGCHKFRDEGELGAAPDLTGYGSPEWLAAMIADPQDERFYADRNDRMPSFAKPALSPDHHLLNPRELKLLVDWLRGDWYEPSGNE